MRNEGSSGHGTVLFLIGLLTGLVEQHFANVRMGLAAHLEGVMNGTFLLAVGAIWNEVRLSTRTKAAAYWTLLIGTYGNWTVTTLAAVLGTAALSPTTAAGARSGALEGGDDHGRIRIHRPGDHRGRHPANVRVAEHGKAGVRRRAANTNRGDGAFNRRA
ncbi:hypothetical protein [Bradyrhizobium sp. LTSP857]|uniref:hypothetical protein n=1 Tax=Bradyrhizobium sp. LTSP857 TaxID=1619231 RepID=UPI0018CC9FC3|nr:hypothetical protein [Bradyrhizobium sp. LTSP857]